MVRSYKKLSPSYHFNRRNPPGPSGRVLQDISDFQPVSGRQSFLFKRKEKLLSGIGKTFIMEIGSYIAV